MTIQRKTISFSETTLKQINYLNKEKINELSMTIRTIVEDYYNLTVRAEKKVKAVFTEVEWNYIHDMLNSTLIDSQLPLQSVLKAQIEDADYYDGLGNKWKIDVEKLIEKIESLSEFECYIIYKLAKEFWTDNIAGEKIDNENNNSTN